MVNSEIHAHDSTVRRRLLDAGQNDICPQISEEVTFDNTNEEKNLIWAKMQATWTPKDWEYVLFS